ncbi:MAG TPA: hypothetical protein VJU16_06635 [Planctomycetota bacterium]|nr:hypothetical protein [Planctomycetota bacterium]
MPAALLLLIAALLPQDPDAEKLKKFEDSFKGKDSSGRSSGGSQDSKSSGWDDDDDDGWNFLEDICADFLAYPFLDNGLRFDSYPYARGRKYFRSIRRIQEGESLEAPAPYLAFETEVTVGRVEHDLWSTGVRAMLRLPSGCDFAIDWSRYTEVVDDGTDHLSLTQFQFNIGGAGRAKSRSYQWSAGFGLATLDGEDVSDVGASLQAALVLYPAEPFSLRFSAAAIAFEHATLNDLRAEVGIHVGRFAIMAGFRSLISSRGGDDLTGPTLGIAMFF